MPPTADLDTALALYKYEANKNNSESIKSNRQDFQLFHSESDLEMGGGSENEIEMKIFFWNFEINVAARVISKPLIERKERAHPVALWIDDW